MPGAQIEKIPEKVSSGNSASIRSRAPGSTQSQAPAAKRIRVTAPLKLDSKLMIQPPLKVDPKLAQPPLKVDPKLKTQRPLKEHPNKLDPKLTQTSPKALPINSKLSGKTYKTSPQLLIQNHCPSQH